MQFHHVGDHICSKKVTMRYEFCNVVSSKLFYVAGYNNEAQEYQFLESFLVKKTLNIVICTFEFKYIIK